MKRAKASQRWLPVNFSFKPQSVSVRWLDFGSKRITEPFFMQTIQSLRSANPPAAEQTTNLGPLLELADSLPPVRPAGLIFHITRCGSTLLANVLGTGDRTMLFYEARPIGQFFHPGVFADSPFPEEGWSDARKMLLNAVTSVYADAFGADDPQVVIKCHGVNILQIRMIRSVWPEVPCVVLIRDPLEVMVSNFDKPAGWVSFREHPRVAHKVFGWPEADVRQMSLEEYCARGIARFLECADDVLDSKCKVVDYSHLDSATMVNIADLFQIRIPPPQSPRVLELMATYAKDPDRKMPFVSDYERKQNEATQKARDCALTWAQTPYQTLRKAESWVASGHATPAATPAIAARV
jgi:hypothetical protein